MPGPIPHRRATYQDVIDTPEHQVAELINGVLYRFSRPRFRHASAAGDLMYELKGPFQRGRGGPGGWIFLAEPELHFGEDVVVPDMAGWRRERLPPIGDEAFTTIAPDWLCEVLSRSTEKHDRMRKLPVYAAAGVKHVWLVHPSRRTVEVLRLHEGKWLTVAGHDDTETVRAEPFDAIALDLSQLWLELATHANEPAAEYGAAR